MAHPSQTAFFQSLIDAFPEHFAGAVLDIGSLDVNGGPHELLSPREYVGVDLGPGPNVSLVGRGEELDLPTGYFDVTMSSECFEHNPQWRSTLHNMIRMTRPGGLVAFTCATTGRPEHGTSRSDGGHSAPLAVEVGQEYYRNVTPRDVNEALEGASLDSAFVVVNRGYSDLMFAALKHPSSPDDVVSLLACRDLNRERFGRNRYPGNPIFRTALTMFGDRGAAGYHRVRRLL